jgi:hypothetical protein
MNKAMVKEQFFQFGEIIRRAVAAKDAYRKRLAELKSQSDNYSEEYIRELQDKALAELQAKNQPLYDDWNKHAEKLATALNELGGQWDRSALSDTVGLIKSIGAELDFEEISKLNAPFANDQAALRILQKAYKAAGVSYDGGLDKQIYHLESTLQEIDSLAHTAFVQNGSLNMLAGKVAKFAVLEGHEFENTPDDAGVMEAMLTGAGLS